ncbi:P-loop containing nucleoside triphosphate hydrolase protein [Hymenopellis radicata]|nr:P-loop containing nucleoside triphosphate hydrolase protein [Hymenopellis radicata]
MLSYISNLLTEHKQEGMNPSAADPTPINHFDNLSHRDVSAAQVLQALEQHENPFTTESYSTEYRDLLDTRKLLPVYNKLADFLTIFQSNNQVMLLTGETGSGKSTQIPQFVIYSDLPHLKGTMIACTEPRKIAATSIAERVAKEMDVDLGEHVGYSIRFEEVVNSDTTILKYLTDGMLLHEAMHDPDLTKYSVVILDESQERTVNNDILMGLLKGIIRSGRRPDLKVIVMSAVDNPRFRQFFDIRDDAFLSVTGRTYPVAILYNEIEPENYNDAVIEQVLTIHVTQGPGDILVFLTGAKEIEDACRELNAQAEDMRIRNPKNIGLLHCIPLYASLSADDQDKVFKPAPPPKFPGGPPSRKVVIASNIAETSLTIDGVVYVVDCGWEKSDMYDPKTGIERLQRRYISQAAAQQRSGRAGRTQPGKCYRLYTERRYLKEFGEHTYPQILRCNIATVVLILIKLGVRVVNDSLVFDFMDAPEIRSVARALELLRALGAIDASNTITEQGTIMADFPMNPQLAKALVVSAKYECSKDMVTIAAMICTRNIWLRPSHRIKEADQAKKSFVVPGGDHLTLLNVYKKYAQNRDDKEWPWENYLSSHGLEEAEEIRVQLKQLMNQHGLPLVSSSAFDKNIRKALLAGFFTQVAYKVPNGKTYRTVHEKEDVLLHPSCAFPFNDKPEWVVYNKFIFTTRAFMQDVSIIQQEWLYEIAPQYFNMHLAPSHAIPNRQAPPPHARGAKKVKDRKGKAPVSRVKQTR